MEKKEKDRDHAAVTGQQEAAAAGTGKQGSGGRDQSGRDPEAVEVEVLPPSDLHGGHPGWNARDEEQYCIILQEAFETGQSIAATAKRHDIPARTVQAWVQSLKELRQADAELFDLRLGKLLEDKGTELINALDKNKVANAGLRDIGVVLGILLDKRKDLVGPRKGSGSTHLRIAWDGKGSAALELKTGTE